jgi:hypothetical protein
MRHEKKFEGFPRPAYTVLHADLLHRSEEFAWGTDPWLMPMARHGVPPALFELWNLVPRITAAVKPRNHTLSTFALIDQIETHILELVNLVCLLEKIKII